MDHFRHILEINFGVVTRRQLRPVLTTDSELRRAVADGALERIRTGWFRSPLVPPHPDVLRAVHAGGVLSGAAALALRGAWDLGGPIEIRAAKLQLIRPPLGTRPVVLQRDQATPCSLSVDRLDTALRVIAQTRAAREVTRVADSLIHRRFVSADELHRFAARVPEPARSALLRADGSSESGTETCVRLWLESNGIKYRAQVVIEGVGRVDFLIGKRLVIEVDSKAHHTGMEGFHRDRDRDLELIARGYLPIRITYAHVMHDWERTAARILTVIRRREHERAPVDVRIG